MFVLGYADNPLVPIASPKMGQQILAKIVKETQALMGSKHISGLHTAFWPRDALLRLTSSNEPWVELNRNGCCGMTVELQSWVTCGWGCVGWKAPPPAGKSVDIIFLSWHWLHAVWILYSVFWGGSSNSPPPPRNVSRDEFDDFFIYFSFFLVIFWGGVEFGILGGISSRRYLESTLIRTFEYVSHFIRCDTVTVPPNQIISYIYYYYYHYYYLMWHYCFRWIGIQGRIQKQGKQEGGWRKCGWGAGHPVHWIFFDDISLLDCYHNLIILLIYYNSIIIMIDCCNYRSIYNLGLQCFSMLSGNYW